MRERVQEYCITKKGLPFPPILLPQYIKYIKPIEISQGNRLYQKLLDICSGFYFISFLRGEGEGKETRRENNSGRFLPTSVFRRTSLLTNYNVIS